MDTWSLNVQVYIDKEVHSPEMVLCDNAVCQIYSNASIIKV